MVELVNRPGSLQTLWEYGVRSLVLMATFDPEIPVSYLFSGPDAALKLPPQPAESVVPPPGLVILLESSAQLLYCSKSAPAQT